MVYGAQRFCSLEATRTFGCHSNSNRHFPNQPAVLALAISNFRASRFRLSRLDNLKVAGSLRPADWLMAFWLGLIGYLGYFLAVVGAGQICRTSDRSSFLGLVPVVLAIAGNWRQRTVSWRDLTLPLSLTAVGLILVNSGSFNPASPVRLESVVLGISFALAAVGLWTWFGLLNQSALAKRTQIDAGVWTALIMAGAGLGMLVFVPFGSLLGVFRDSQTRSALGGSRTALYLGYVIGSYRIGGWSISMDVPRRNDCRWCFPHSLITIETLFRYDLSAYWSDIDGQPLSRALA